MSNEFAEATLHRIATGNYTPEELSTFLQALDQLDEAAFVQVYNRLYELIAQQQPDAIDERFRASLEDKLNRLPVDTAPVRPMRTTAYWFKFAAAAAVVLLITGAVYWLTTKNKTTSPASVVASKTTTPIDAPPGGNHATLTLSNGTVIVLDQAKAGDVAQQGGSRIVKPDSGQLVYYAPASANGAIEYNTVSTPRAGQFHIILPDGTHVWLNAASSLRFPTAFTGKTREVQLSGEGYFEVAHNAAKPFIAKIRSGGSVEVLGTHFNINAYEDEPVIKTTLLEGSVRMSFPAIPDKSGQAGNRQSAMDNFREVILKPGEQAVLASDSRLPTADSRLTIDHSPDIEKEIAWKNGFFEFNNMSLPVIMRQISRWYDVDVSLAANYPDKRFGGRISRKLNLASIVSMLETYGVHFKMENKKLVVIQ